MKRIVLFAALVLSACTRGEQPTAPEPDNRVPTTPVPPGVTRAAPIVRVGIALDTNTVTLSAPNAFELRTSSNSVLAKGDAGESWQFTRSAGNRVRVTSGTRSVGEFDLPVRITTKDGDLVDIAGRRYRGTALVTARGADKLSAINVVDLELYLLGVVPREMGKRPASEIEALKTQAVAARTYAIGNVGGRENEGFDYYATVMDQVYGGITDEDSIVSRSVRETRGEIVTYDGRPIQAYYSSTCGGHTADVEQSWPWRGLKLPYLRGVSDQIPGTDQYYCGSSSRFRWRTEWTHAQLLAVLAQTLGLHTNGKVTSAKQVNEVRLVQRGEGAKRAIIELVADGQTYTLRADSIRWTMRPQPGAAILNSSYIFSLGATKDGDHIDKLAVEGGGWGHAIGMCQVGAMGRARAGQSYRQILLAYYTGTSIDRLY